MLVFPAAGEMPPSSGRKYKLRRGRSRIRRPASAHDYPIDVGLVSGDDVYHGLVERDSLLAGRAGQFIGSRVGGRPDAWPSAVHGLGPNPAPGSTLADVSAFGALSIAPSPPVPSGPVGARRQEPDAARRGGNPGRPAPDCAGAARIQTRSARGRAIAASRSRVQHSPLPGQGR